MPNPMTMTAPKPGTRQAQAPVLPMRRFIAGAYERVELMDDRTVALGAAVSNFDVPAFGFLRSLLVEVTGTTAANAAAVTFTEDGPWSVIADLALSDTNGAPIVGPISGYDLFLINLLGGYAFAADPQQDPFYSAVTGVGAGLGGSFAFILRVPVEIVGRDCIGALSNMNAAGTYKFRYTLAASAGVYGVAPTTPPVVRVRCWCEQWTQPAEVSPKGKPQAQVPPGNGTMQFWSKQVVPTVAGANRIRLTRMGNMIRSLVFIMRDNAGTPVRTTTGWPDLLTQEWDGRTLLNVGRNVMRRYMQERYGYVGATQLPTGVFILNYDHEFDGHPGGELRDLWLPTTTATRIDLSGVFAAGNLTILTNDVAPRGDIEES